MKKKLSVFSFFSGAGFLDLGFEKAGFETVFANELDKNFATAYSFSRKKMKKNPLSHGLHLKSIDCFLAPKPDNDFLREAINNERKNNSIVGFIGGPPCPDFSVAGKNKGNLGQHGRLSSSYIDLICGERPDFFVFENVKGLWRTARHRKFFDSLVKKVQENGYLTTTRLVNALEYGVPQDRDRIILIGIKNEILTRASIGEGGNINGFPWNKFIKYSINRIKTTPWPRRAPFTKTLSTEIPKGVIKNLTVQYWFEKNSVTTHPNAKDMFAPRAGLEKMRTFDEGDDSRKCYKRLHRWRYSPTVAYGNNEVHLHPYEARRISVSEALALQSLPRSFELPEDMSLTAKFKTIGNGVPFLLAYGIAKTLKTFLTKEK